MPGEPEWGGLQKPRSSPGEVTSSDTSRCPFFVDVQATPAWEQECSLPSSWSSEPLAAYSYFRLNPRRTIGFQHFEGETEKNRTMGMGVHS